MEQNLRLSVTKKDEALDLKLYMLRGTYSLKYHFLTKTCCDFKKLEGECNRWEKEHNS